MTSPTDHPDQSGRTSAASVGDATDGAVDLTRSTAPADESNGTGVDTEGNNSTIEAPSPNNSAGRVSIAQIKSPLPPPDVMEAYEAIQPGAFDRILKLTEQENAHRINEAEREGVHRRTVVENDQKAGIADQRRGMYYGTLAVLIVVLGVVACAWIDEPWPAAILAGGLSGVIAVFAWRQRRGNSGDQDRP